MKNALLLIFAFTFPILMNAQDESTTVYSIHGNQIKKSKYYEIKGSPHLFKGWIKGDLIHLQDGAVEDATIRLDLYKNDLEVLEGGLGMDKSEIQEVDGDKFIVLDDKFYNKVLITKKDNPKALKDYGVDSLYLMKGIHRDYLNKFAVVLYDGENVKLVRTIEVKYRETKINSPGKIEKIKKFVKSKGYALIKDREKIEIKLKDKAFYKVLGKENELKAFKKANKLKMKKDFDFVKLLKYYDTL